MRINDNLIAIRAQIAALDRRVLTAMETIEESPKDGVPSANLTNKPLWADLPNERVINNAGPGNPITLTQTNVNEGHWHYVNTASSAVTITLPNGLKVVSGEGRIRCLATFWCVSYSNPVSFVIGSDYTDSTNGGTITAASQVYSLTASQDVGQALPNIKIVPGAFAS